MNDVTFTKIDQFEEPERWLELRRTGIGGSDAGAIMGMNKYASPLTVYMQKKGFDVFKGNNATVWGHILENPIRELAARELGIEIESVDGMYTSKEYPFMNANLDGICHADHQITIDGVTVSGVGGHEIKTSGKGEGFGDGEIPDSYYCQCQHYMAVTGFDWFILTVFFLSSRAGRHYIVRRNDTFIDALIRAEKDFWENYVEKDICPAPSGIDSESEYLSKLDAADEVELDASAEAMIFEERGLAEKIKELEKNREALKNKIILAIHDASHGLEPSERTVAKAGSFKVTYATQVRKSVDSDALKAAGLFDQYAKESSFKVIRISGGAK